LVKVGDIVSSIGDTIAGKTTNRAMPQSDEGKALAPVEYIERAKRE
jgi:hypothetical protein